MEDIKSTVSQERAFFIAIPAFVWQILFFFLPLAFIVGISFIKDWDTPLLSAFTLQHYSSFIDPIYFTILARSFLLAAFNGCACLILGYPIAYFLAVKVRKWKNSLLFFLMLPFWTNLLVLIYAWFFILERHGLINSILIKLGFIAEPLQLLNTPWAIYLVMLYCYLPFMIMPLYSILEKLDRTLLEVSLDLGANPLKTFINVTIPLSLSGIRTGFFLVFIPSFGEFVIPSLIGGGKHMFVGSLISHYFLVSRDAFLGSAFTTVSGLALILFALVFHWAVRNQLKIIKGVANQ